MLNVLISQRKKQNCTVRNRTVAYISIVIERNDSINRCFIRISPAMEGFKISSKTKIGLLPDLGRAHLSQRTRFPEMAYLSPTWSVFGFIDHSITVNILKCILFYSRRDLSRRKLNN